MDRDALGTNNLQFSLLKDAEESLYKPKDGSKFLEGWKFYYRKPDSKHIGEIAIFQKDDKCQLIQYKSSTNTIDCNVFVEALDSVIKKQFSEKKINTIILGSDHNGKESLDYLAEKMRFIKGKNNQYIKERKSYYFDSISYYIFEVLLYLCMYELLFIKGEDKSIPEGKKLGKLGWQVRNAFSTFISVRCCSLLDNPKTKNKENLSIAGFVEEFLNKDKLQEIESKIRNLKRSPGYEKLKERRHKFISHLSRDLEKTVFNFEDTEILITKKIKPLIEDVARFSAEKYCFCDVFFKAQKKAKSIIDDFTHGS